MDETDARLVALLEADGRASYRTLARSVGLSRSTVAGRVHRLLGSGQVEVRGVIHPAVLGRDSLAHVSLRVDGAAASVAAAVADRPDAPFVTLTSGRADVVAELRCSSPAEVDRAVGELRSLEAVRGVETLTYTEVVRDVLGPVPEVSPRVDATDRVLLRALQADGRASYVDLGSLVGLSAAGARRRVRRLLDEQVVRVGGIVHHTGRDRPHRLGVGIRLAGDDAAARERVADLPGVVFLARTLGRYDAVMSLRSLSTTDLVTAVDRLRTTEGVREVETWSHLRVVKETYALEDL